MAFVHQFGSDLTDSRILFDLTLHSSDTHVGLAVPTLLQREAKI